MDTFVESSWYYARYASPACSSGMVDKNAAQRWLPVNQYIGGIEHAILHLLYARFFHKLMRDAGVFGELRAAQNLPHPPSTSSGQAEPPSEGLPSPQPSPASGRGGEREEHSLISGATVTLRAAQNLPHPNPPPQAGEGATVTLRAAQNLDEPFTNLLTQGMVVAPTFYREDARGKKQWINPADVDVETDAKGRPTGAKLRSDGLPVAIGGTEKMSKSKNNGVDPQAIIDKYGADTARLFIMFAAPPDQQLEWSDSGVEGAYRFLRRIWHFAHTRRPAGANLGLARDQSDAAQPEKERRREIHSALKQANNDFGKHQFNTVVSASMKILNTLEKCSDTDSGPAIADGFSILLRLLSPITPHIAQTLWQELGYGDDILAAPWPEVDEAALEQDEIELAIQVNGKLRGSLRAAKDADKATLENLALAHPAVQKQLAGGAAKKVVVVPGRLINVVA
jgi:leucyl-tRNA synthetase